MSEVIGGETLRALGIVTAVKDNLMLQEPRVGKQQRRRHEQDGTPIQSYAEEGLHGRGEGLSLIGLRVFRRRYGNAGTEWVQERRACTRRPYGFLAPNNKAAPKAARMPGLRRVVGRTMVPVIGWRA